MKVIKDLGIKFNHESVSFQVAGILRLSNPSTRKPYLANFEIFLPGNNYLREDYGDLMFDIGGASEEFKGETEYGFNAFFSPGDFNKPNRIMLERILKILRQRNYPRRQIQKINVGEHAMPFARMQSCLYIWRPSYEIFQGDLIKCFELIRKDAEDDSLLLSPEVQTKFQARWDRARDFLSIFAHPFLQEQLRLLNQENTLITDYFNEVAATEEGSFILHHKQVTSYRPLYPVLESFHAKLTEAFAKALNFSPENLWELIAKTWKYKNY